MSRDFDKAKAIRKGELDDSIPDYEVLTGWFQRVPVTWLPGLLAAVTQQCAAKKCFKEGGLQSFVKRCEEIGSLTEAERVLRQEGQANV